MNKRNYLKASLVALLFCFGACDTYDSEEDVLSQPSGILSIDAGTNDVGNGTGSTNDVGNGTGSTYDVGNGTGSTDDVGNGTGSTNDVGNGTGGTKDVGNGTGKG